MPSTDTTGAAATGAAAAPAATRVRRRNNRRGEGVRLAEELLKAADGLIGEYGDTGRLSLRAVAARAGVATTSVYLHFADITALKGALAQRSVAEFAAVCDAAVTGINDPAQALIVRCQAYARHALEHASRYRLMFDAELTQQHSHADCAAEGPVSAGRGDLSPAPFGALVESLFVCRQAGLVPADRSIERLAVLIWTALHGQIILRLDRPRFPWPGLDGMITELVTRLARLPTGAAAPQPGLET